jgi:adenylate cyclase class 2
VLKLEIEVKLRVHDPSGILDRIERAGAKLMQTRELEDNRVLDFPDQTLQRRGEMLRIRFLERGVILTFKGPGRVESGKKVREETESVLSPSEGATLATILERLGMRQAFRYQKYRTTWELDGVHTTLDETPIGAFLELEGHSVAIDGVANVLGYTPADYIASSYRDLYLMERNVRVDSVDEMIF